MASQEISIYSPRSQGRKKNIHLFLSKNVKNERNKGGKKREREKSEPGLTHSSEMILPFTWESVSTRKHATLKQVVCLVQAHRALSLAYALPSPTSTNIHAGLGAIPRAPILTQPSESVLTEDQRTKRILWQLG